MSNDVILSKNWELRRTVSGVFSVPMFLIISTIVLLPFLFIMGTNMSLLFATVATVVSEIIFLWIVKKWAWGDMTWKDMLVLYKPKTKHIFIGLGVGVLAFIVMQFIAIGLINAFDIELGSSDTSESIINASGLDRLFVTYLFAPFLIPIVEELVFRGAILNGLLNGSTRNWDRWKHYTFSVIVSSVAFSIVHFQGLDNAMDVFVLVWIFFIALINSWLLIRYKSVVVPIAMHIAYNSTTTFLPVLLSQL